ncbi:hypothetical protein COS31_01760 [Candidatus Roizmanbacteria bacterium CG02_land_8_20_14_3_00_36_15]|uniref:Twin-arginine translocation signal domain-containing protein n=2 Tax=Candidatus Roizmaniibacteriota TaxID=1752723 RepID=A0A2M8KMF3_9BACT|nr:MAG: hypothetical protein COS51_05205 [Candidatus Roizmanbacteria bacterium CG03_land_8_20_14_0_80_36_21]PIV38024.1 MAG: hypothetical protein COS31_01760 [Candidatus Roizmanbacteria bacterium CG02_land_8_20_14_3_00_36_15]PIY69740.1 MAG: hypothetical protein COY89_04835 [Candidatus Roizmanbacteria bacterium CG_4_10_14_0_8_um_filter_36_36]PJA52926.1 MAG: hypothetical protein CO166_03655 [Candidatus Roizmanbacteria bacterium CG_4_9_14_3_um_filter_36_11]PJC82332.1 MAG: hypothetical protein CO007
MNPDNRLSIISRRDFLKLAEVAAGGFILACCGPTKHLPLSGPDPIPAPRPELENVSAPNLYLLLFSNWVDQARKKGELPDFDQFKDLSFITPAGDYSGGQIINNLNQRNEPAPGFLLSAVIASTFSETPPTCEEVWRAMWFRFISYMGTDKNTITVPEDWSEFHQDVIHIVVDRIFEGRQIDAKEFKLQQALDYLEKNCKNNYKVTYNPSRKGVAVEVKQISEWEREEYSRFDLPPLDGKAIFSVIVTAAFVYIIFTNPELAPLLIFAKPY